MADAGRAVVTGAFGFTGRYIAGRLLDRGVRLRTLTGHPERAGALGGRVVAHRYDFGDPDAMARSMEGARTFYNTYWIRFEYGDRTFEDAVRHSRALFRAAEAAGVEHVVHVSIANPSLDSPFPYYRGKARVEAALRESGLSGTVLRPALLFGREDILVNNIAWFVRRFPLFPLPGDGDYPVRPIHVDDFARLAVEKGEAGRAGAGSDRAGSGAEAGSGVEVLDAVGPDSFTFRSMVEEIVDAVDGRARPIPAPAALSLWLSKLAGLWLGDVVLTRDELGGLRAGLLGSDAPARGDTRLGPWIREHREEVGTRYASEVDRHYG